MPSPRNKETHFSMGKLHTHATEQTCRKEKLEPVNSEFMFIDPEDLKKNETAFTSLIQKFLSKKLIKKKKRGPTHSLHQVERETRNFTSGMSGNSKVGSGSWRAEVWWGG